MSLATQKPPVEAASAEARTTAPTSEIEDFIYLISHDVRNSVRALIELPQWIVEDLNASGVKIDKSVAESIEMMNTHTGRLDRMLVDLLAYSRVGRMQDVSEIEVDMALTEVLDEMRIPAGFKVVPNISCNTLVMGDRDILTLLTALVSNAIKHHDKPTGLVEVSVSDEGENVCIEVSDDGPGIPQQYRDRVFSAMTTLRPRDEVEGSGMGLAIVRKIASIHGGSSKICDSKSERGAVTKVIIPKINAH